MAKNPPRYFEGYLQFVKVFPNTPKTGPFGEEIEELFGHSALNY
jgi:hypothetical protein